jgi:hypothetical protein
MPRRRIPLPRGLCLHCQKLIVSTSAHLIYCSQRCYRAQQPEPSRIAARFWAKVDKAGPVPDTFPHLGRCWLWTGGRTAFGHGVASRSGRKHTPAHRQSWTLTHGAIPEGFVICHRCDVPACVRPGHLRMATQGYNIRDCVAKGRFRAGFPSKLTAEDIADIRKNHISFKKGYTLKDFAEKYNISAHWVGQIYVGKGPKAAHSR